MEKNRASLKDRAVVQPKPRPPQQPLPRSPPLALSLSALADSSSGTPSLVPPPSQRSARLETGARPRGRQDGKPAPRKVSEMEGPLPTNPRRKQKTQATAPDGGASRTASGPGERPRQGTSSLKQPADAQDQQSQGHPAGRRPSRAQHRPGARSDSAALPTVPSG